MVTLNKLIQMWEKSCKLSLVEIFLLLLQCLWTITHNIGGYELTIWDSVLHITWMKFSINSNLLQPNIMHVSIYSVFCILVKLNMFLVSICWLSLSKREEKSVAFLFWNRECLVLAFLFVLVLICIFFRGRSLKKQCFI